MKTHSKKIRSLGLKSIITLLILILTAFFSNCARSNAGEPEGWIAFLWSDEKPPRSGMDLILSDGNGNTLRYVGYFTGSPSFSTDGKLLAVGCPPDPDTEIVTSLCILDISSFISERLVIPFAQSFSKPSAIKSRIPLPERCQVYQSNKVDGTEGILSLSWSPSDDRLVIVCGNIAIQEVCILSLGGESDCWEQSASNNILRAVWSPADDNLLAISGQGYPTSEIYLVNTDGADRHYIAEGINPEWSPDGKHIAYVEYVLSPLTGNRSAGIASVDLNGLDHQWLYLPDPENPMSFIGLGGSAWPSRLAWSPDGNYITFSMVYGGLYNYEIGRLEISTGKVVFLVDDGIFDHIVVEPDWGP